MSFIPPELICHVLESGYYTKSGTKNYNFLIACTLVCRTWSGHAQTLLFRSTPRLTRRSLSKFYAAILSSAVRGTPFRLGDCVRTLDISIGRARIAGFSPGDLANLLQACPRVYELVLCIYGQFELEGDTLEKLRVAGQRLKALNVVYCHGGTSIPLRLLNIWPNIQFLDLGDLVSMSPFLVNEVSVLQGNTNVDDAEELVQRPTSGAEVRLYDLVLPMHPRSDILTWLLASSTDSLRILCLRSRLQPLHLPILALHAPRLRSLRLSHYNENCAALLQKCVALEELVIWRMSLLPLAPDLPRTIEHLSFRHDEYNNTVPLVVEAVDVLPNLRILTCDRDLRRIHADYAKLSAKCKIKGAEFVVSKIPWVGVESDHDASALC
jgi:hypothetical protein